MSIQEKINNFESQVKIHVFDAKSNLPEEDKIKLIDQLVGTDFTTNFLNKKEKEQEFSEKGKVLINLLKRVKDLPDSIKEKINTLEDTNPKCDTIYHWWLGETQESAKPVRGFPSSEYDKKSSDATYQYAFDKANQLLEVAYNLSKEKNLGHEIIHSIRDTFKSKSHNNSNKIG